VLEMRLFASVSSPHIRCSFFMSLSCRVFSGRGLSRSHLGHFARFEIVPRSDAPRRDFLERDLFWRERGIFGAKIHT
jgi:hypothetical protein